MVVKYKDRPLEFWDVHSHAFLRELVSNPPTFSCVEWSPSPKQPKAQKTNTTDLLTFGASVSTVDFDVAMGAVEHKSTQVLGQLNYCKCSSHVTLYPGNGARATDCDGRNRMHVADLH